MHVIHRGARVVLDDKLLLGQGGEARVFAHPSLPLALKIFHDGASASLTRLREKKLRAFPRDLPSLVVAPEDVLADDAGAVVGYAMKRVDNAFDIAALAKKGRAQTASEIVAVFRVLAMALDELHKRFVVVGDLNDGNVVLTTSAGALQPWLIDCDSMQVGVLPCPVAHERFLDPRLYGKSLVDDACFDAGADAFAVRVLLFQSLLCVHPYGGVHAKLATLLRRAEASWSVLRGDVQLPRAAIPFQTLSDDMLDDFARCFDKGERTPLSTSSALERIKFRRCSCGVEHARGACPMCRTVVQAPSIRTQGGVREEVIYEGRGVVLHARAQRALRGAHANDVAFLVDHGARVVREDGSTVFAGARPAAMRFAIAGDATWLALDVDVSTDAGGGAKGGGGANGAGGAKGSGGVELVKVQDERPLDRAYARAWTAGRGGLFVVEGDALVHHETRARVGRVLEGNTLLLAADDGGVGLYRAGRALMAFGFARDRFFDVELPQPRGKIVDIDATFGMPGVTSGAVGAGGAGGAGRDGAYAGFERALVGIAEDIDGKRVHTLALVDGRGRLIAQASGAPESEPMLASIRGKCIAGSKVLSTSNEGVCAVDVAGDRLVTGSIFADTRPFVDDSVELLAGAGGSLVVVARQAITRLRLQP